MTFYLNHMLIMKLRFDAILYSKLGKEYSDAGDIKCSSTVWGLLPGLVRFYLTAATLCILFVEIENKKQKMNTQAQNIKINRRNIRKQKKTLKSQ